MEHDPEFRAVTADIRVWSETRNDAMHGVARIFRHEDTATSFDAAMNIHGQTVLDGIAVLRRFDRLDTAARQARKDIPAHKRFPATWPAAFFPEERSGTPRPAESDAH
ncbi:hypothetical protein D7D52_26920 [Nocardia yunnanensis]|uniref:Uncharacterized protein n=1 Tax=Nocardia yunnanensis TaxID=2382165 RepID=A0A386ZG15_9NOCA|nr:hypothetical protein [Nocardia yunnanensis]AYF76842.1 hypothetical protein D7D52_26920 [Nocardia yunnanensis]